MGDGSPRSRAISGGAPWSTQGTAVGAAWLPISAASRSSMPERLGSSFCIFLRTATALVAKPSRARSSASRSRTSAASPVFPASAWTCASWTRSRSFRLFSFSSAVIISIAFG